MAPHPNHSPAASSAVKLANMETQWLLYLISWNLGAPSPLTSILPNICSLPELWKGFSFYLRVVVGSSKLLKTCKSCARESRRTSSLACPVWPPHGWSDIPELGHQVIKGFWHSYSEERLVLQWWRGPKCLGHQPSLILLLMEGGTCFTTFLILSQMEEWQETRIVWSCFCYLSLWKMKGFFKIIFWH